ncbi:MAG: PepSY-associated TM helix domain-containing protein [Sphingomonas sp.]
MKWIDLAHRWTGGIVGVILVLMGLTGTLLLHRNAWIALPHTGDAQVQDTATVAAVVAQVMGDPTTRPQSITFATRDFGLDLLAWRDGRGAYLDQHGGLVATWSSDWARPELWLFDLHHYLLLGEVGETIVGIAGLAGLLFVVTGAILWWRTRKTFAFRLWPARLSRPAIVRQHRDLGIVVAPILLITFVTGVLLVFRPLTAVVMGPGAPAEIAGALAPPPARPAPLADRLDWAAMIGAARERFPDAEVRSLSLPAKARGLIRLRMRRPDEWLRNGRTTVWFAADTGAIVKATDADTLPRRVRAYNLIFPIHSGEIGGIAYRLLLTVSGLSLVMLGSFAIWSFWFKRPRQRGGR